MSDPYFKLFIKSCGHLLCPSLINLSWFFPTLQPPVQILTTVIKTSQTNNYIPLPSPIAMLSYKKPSLGLRLLLL